MSCLFKIKWNMRLYKFRVSIWKLGNKKNELSLIPDILSSFPLAFLLKLNPLRWIIIIIRYDDKT